MVGSLMRLPVGYFADAAYLHNFSNINDNETCKDYAIVRKVFY